MAFPVAALALAVLAAAAGVTYSAFSSPTANAGSYFATATTFTTPSCTGIRTIAGGPGSGAPATQIRMSPRAVAVDGTTAVVLADSDAHVVRSINTASQDAVLRAGTGAAGARGDGGAAVDAELSSPFGVAVDASGTTYVADRANNRIRKITTGGTISTFAGDGTAASTGDGGPATAASLNLPRGVAAHGDVVYIADTAGHRIRKVAADGTISTVAGTGTAGAGGDGGAATSAQLSGPQAVAVASDGTLYVADTGNNKIRRITPGGAISTIAGTGTPGATGDGGAATAATLSGPTGVAVDAAGNVLIGDTTNNKVRRVNTSGTISTFAGTGTAGSAGDGGAATAAQLSGPRGLAVDASGVVYIADYSNFRLRRVSAGGTISTFGGTGVQGGWMGHVGDGGPATSAQFNQPYGVAFDDAGSLYVADMDNNKVRKITPSGTISTFAGTGTVGAAGDGGPAASAQLNMPQGMAVDSAGNVFIADGQNNKVRKVAPNGTISTYAGTGAAGATGDGGAATAARLDYPRNVALDAAGNLYIADHDNHKIRKVTPGGTISTFAGTGQSGSTGDGGPATSAKMNNPYGLALDAAGNVYLSNWGEGKVRKVNTSGTISTVAGIGGFGYSGDGGPATSAQLGMPHGVAVAADGSLYIGDYNNHRIRRVTPAGTISTLAGTGTGAFGGDCGPLAAATLNYPVGVVVRGGYLYVADSYNARIRRIDLP